MMQKKQVVWFEEVDKHDVGLVGGKGANLGEMIQAHLPIPYGFIVTSHAYFEFIKEAMLERRIPQLLSMINYDNPHELQQVSSHIRELILQAPISKKIINTIFEYYSELPIKEEKFMHKNPSLLSLSLKKIHSVYHPPLVAVRSSATAEDLPQASFAGQQETYLNVRGESHLIQKIKQCWSSLFTERAIFYRNQNHFDHLKVGLAAVVQRMIQSEKSGIAFSIDPITNDKSKIIIEAIFGLGEYIVGGKVTPDHYEINKQSLVILKKEIKTQPVQLIKKGTENKEAHVSSDLKSAQKISDEEIVSVTLLVKEIENHYFFPQDIEWAIEGKRVFIVQSRPITTISNRSSAISGQSKTEKPISENRKPIVTGSPASPGIGVGPVRIIMSPKHIDKIKRGEVLVAPQTNPDYVPAMKKAAAIITEKGGRTSHAAIVSRELGIPAVVGAEHALRVLKDEMVISVNGATGEIFKGSIISNRSSVVSSQLKTEKPTTENRQLKTVTKVYVNLAEPDQAYKISQLNVDGIGLLRAEFIIAQIGEHPMEFVKHKKTSIFVNRLAKDLHVFVKAFSPRPVVYRATDFKTNEYRNLKFGAKYESHEENPMLGYRGAYRYIDNPDVFKMELEAIKKIHSLGYHNIHLMIPFVRVPWELIRIKELIQESGLLENPHFKLWIMVEVPACALHLNDFLKIGINGVSIGTNDLTMMLLGVDRDNEKVSPIYDERHPAVVDVLRTIVKTCAQNGVTCSICGQAASDYPDLVEQLVKDGITSVSVNPDAITRTRELIHNIEKRLYKNK